MAGAGLCDETGRTTDFSGAGAAAAAGRHAVAQIDFCREKVVGFSGPEKNMTEPECQNAGMLAACWTRRPQNEETDCSLPGSFAALAAANHTSSTRSGATPEAASGSVAAAAAASAAAAAASAAQVAERGFVSDPPD